MALTEGFLEEKEAFEANLERRESIGPGDMLKGRGAKEGRGKCISHRRLCNKEPQTRWLKHQERIVLPPLEARNPKSGVGGPRSRGRLWEGVLPASFRPLVVSGSRWCPLAWRPSKLCPHIHIFFCVSLPRPRPRKHCRHSVRTHPIPVRPRLNLLPSAKILDPNKLTFMGAGD